MSYQLTALSPLDGRYSEKVSDLRPYFSEFALIRYRVLVEIRWFLHLAESTDLPDGPKISMVDRTYLLKMISVFSVEDAQAIKNIEATTNHDVKAVEYWIRDRFEESESLKKWVGFIHFACTSEDINNLSYALMLSDARTHVLSPCLQTIIQVLNDLATYCASMSMLSRTHGQPASPTTMGKEIKNFSHRLLIQKDILENILIYGKINGAVGNYNAHQWVYPEIAWPNIACDFVKSLGLTFNSHTTQIEPHDNIARYFDALKGCNQIIQDLNQDMWGYISLNYFSQKVNANEVGSSTMPHKVNPIDFENSEGNLSISTAICEMMSRKLPISRWQRDLSDSTVLRNLGVAAGHSVLAFRSTLKGLGKLKANPDLMVREVAQAWEVLAEPIQMVMRRYGIANPYEQLKALSRGQRVNEEILHDFIKKSELPENEKQRLLGLTPDQYIGNAVALAKVEM